MPSDRVVRPLTAEGVLAPVEESTAHEPRVGPAFEDGSASLVYLAHVFEHLSFHTEAPRLAREVLNFLEADGVWRLAVPDMQAYLDEYASAATRRYRLPAWAPLLSARSSMPMAVPFSRLAMPSAANAQ